MSSVLPNANDLRQAADDKTAKRRQASIDKQLAEMAEKLKKNREVSTLPLMPEVVAELEAQGFTVTFYKGFGIGGCDSHTTSW